MRFHLCLIVVVLLNTGCYTSATTHVFECIKNGNSKALDDVLKRSPAAANAQGSAVVKGIFKDAEERTFYPLMYATYLGDAKCAEVLLSHNADPNALDEYRATALHEAAMRGNGEIVRLLIEHGAQVNAPNVIRLTPLKAATNNDQVECARLLIESGANVLAISGRRESVLHNIRSVEMAKLLLDANAKLDAINSEGETPLHHAVVNGFIDLTVFLIEQGAAVDIRDEERNTAIDVARARLKPDDFNRIEKAVSDRVESLRNTPQPSRKDDASPAK